ncbi:hypothetical protein HYC85_013987 [Camellia sinensis]|uniref:Uncharacterized protein n=1 Tax=Camellia sinensis TaxID=4442 RepID=A0A7J7H4Y9_CAMSI|nr:hypothetical protein HYC85_013987 [Camellia sinensis]
MLHRSMSSSPSDAITHSNTVTYSSVAANDGDCVFERVVDEWRTMKRRRLWKVYYDSKRETSKTMDYTLD